MRSHGKIGFGDRKREEEPGLGIKLGRKLIKTQFCLHCRTSLPQMFTQNLFLSPECKLYNYSLYYTACLCSQNMCWMVKVLPQDMALLKFSLSTPCRSSEILGRFPKENAEKPEIPSSKAYTSKDLRSFLIFRVNQIKQSQEGAVYSRCFNCSGKMAEVHC